MGHTLSPPMTREEEEVLHSFLDDGQLEQLRAQVTPTSLRMLALIYRHPGLSGEVCAKRLGVDPTTACRALRRLDMVRPTSTNIANVLTTHRAALPKKSNVRGSQEGIMVALIHREPGIEREELRSLLDVNEKTIRNYFRRLEKRAQSDRVISKVLERHKAWEGLRPLYLLLRIEPGLDRGTLAARLALHESTVSKQLTLLTNLGEPEADEVLRIHWSTTKRKHHAPPHQENELLRLIKSRPGLSNAEYASLIGCSTETIIRYFRLLRQRAKSEPIAKALELHEAWRGLRPLHELLEEEPYLTRRELARRLKVNPITVTRRVERLEALSAEDDRVRRELWAQGMRTEPPPPIILFCERWGEQALTYMASGGYYRYREKLDHHLNRAVERKTDKPFFAEQVVVHTFALFLYVNRRRRAVRDPLKVLDDYKVPLILMSPILREFEYLKKK